MDPSAAAEIFRRTATELGFSRIGFTPVGEVARHRAYRDWLARGYAADMRYMSEHSDKRRDPASLFDAARTVITVALSYAHPDTIPADRLARGTVARYARGDDYHSVLKDKLYTLARRAAAELGRDIAFLPCVDTAPLLEREAAHQSGLGFIAKNTMLIAPGAGSYLLLGELLTDVECAPGAPAEPRCGRCRACLDACPTGAFVDAYTLDARRCISYLTIELTGPIPLELRPLIGDHVFGCDICQDVCPFNKSASDGAPELAPRPGVAHPELTRLLSIGSAQFRQWNRRSALRRVHRPQLQRNAAVALGNVGTDEHLPALAAALDGPYPLARAHVAWAIGRIAARSSAASSARALDLLRDARAREPDPSVQAELDAALTAAAAPAPRP